MKNRRVTVPKQAVRGTRLVRRGSRRKTPSYARFAAHGMSAWWDEDYRYFTSAYCARDLLHRGVAPGCPLIEELLR